MRKLLIITLFTASFGFLGAQENECEEFISEYETWVEQTTDAVSKNNGKSISSKALTELKMDFEQWEMNIEAFRKNDCSDGSYFIRIEKAHEVARKSLGIKATKP